ncbi:MAG: hypothetical protein KF747_04500 [Nitrospira sp.]|nr:hypothetical protein [Nitrospira sp.]
MNLTGLQKSLQNLDLRPNSMVAAAIAVDPRPAADPLRGLSITAEDAARSLRTVSWPTMESKLAHPEFERLAMLSAAFRLNSFESDALLIALAPEIDARYEPFFDYLQDVLTRNRPSVDLLMDLIGLLVSERVQVRRWFARKAR